MVDGYQLMLLQQGQGVYLSVRMLESNASSSIFDHQQRIDASRLCVPILSLWHLLRGTR
jgi:hypothetical protein